MATQVTMLWATDVVDAANRELLDATAAKIGLAVRYCTLPGLSSSARAGRDQLIGIETGGDSAPGLALVAEVHKLRPRATIFLASPDGGVDFIRAALGAGCSDVLSLPLQSAELHNVLLRSTQVRSGKATPAESLGEVITVCGARGALGATTVAVNLAFRLAALTRGEIALVDLDLQRGDVAAFLDLNPVNSLANLAKATGPIDQTFLAGTLTRHPDGVFVLPAPTEIEEADSVGHEEVKVALDLLRARFRYTVVDTARSVTGAMLAAFEASRRILLLSDLSVPGIRAARRTVELLTHLGVPADHVELVVSEAIAGPVSLEDATRAIGKSVFFVIPRDQHSAVESMNQGVPLNGAPTKLALAMTELAAKVSGVTAPERPRPGQLFRRLFARTERAHA